MSFPSRTGEHHPTGPPLRFTTMLPVGAGGSWDCGSGYVNDSVNHDGHSPHTLRNDYGDILLDQFRRSAPSGCSTEMSELA